jgi:aerobic carbon-monoxide dehydrogenase small subunit
MKEKYMSEKPEENTKNEESENLTQGQISRRSFLKEAGIVAGGVTLGSITLANSCKSGSDTTSATTPAAPGASTTAPKTTAPPVTVTTVAETAVADLLTLNVNGKSYYVQNKDNWTLAYVLREKLGLTGTKRGCDDGSCGVCTVIVDGRPVMSCIMLAVEADGKVIQTIEGDQKAAGKLSVMQQAFVDGDAIQCGFCIPAMVLTAEALLAFKPKPTRDDVREFLGGTLCRCGVHQMAIDAILKVAG